MNVIENSDNPQLKLKSIQQLIFIVDKLDKNYLWDQVLITLEKVRTTSQDTDINMYLLTLYEKISGALTPEDIGNRILPGLIPMLISASLSKA